MSLPTKGHLLPFPVESKIIFRLYINMYMDISFLNEVSLSNILKNSWENAPQLYGNYGLAKND